MIFSIFIAVLIALCSELLGLDTKIMQDSFNTWGPSAHTCIRFARAPKEISRYKEDVSQAVSQLIENPNKFTGFNDEATHRVFVIRPSTPSRQLRTVEFGTNHLRETVARAYAELKHDARYSFYKTFRGAPWFRGPAGELYKIHVLLWFLHTRAEETLPCTGAVARFPELKLPSCPKDPKFFYKPEELSELSEPGQPKCLIPTSRIFPALDAVILTTNAIIMVTTILSPTHDAKEEGFGLILQNLPPDLLRKRPNRYHLFITDTETNAKSLRLGEQNRKDKYFKSLISAPTPGGFVSVTHMGYDAEKGSTSSGVDPSWLAFLRDLQAHGVDEAVIAQNMDFIKSFVREAQKSEPSSRVKPPPPPPSPRAPSSRRALHVPPPPPSRGTPPSRPPSNATSKLQPPHLPPPSHASAAPPPPHPAPPAPSSRSSLAVPPRLAPLKRTLTYSAVIDVDDLDLQALATTKRAIALQKARVSSTDCM